mmetsp:Transcript_10281/g.27030  ORF Transcript_10281/g.27030 Transcript_10281/m.27030 type:complete len:462 (+) Transcript_10281:170-1555(+)
MTSASNTPGVAVQDTALLQASASAPGKNLTGARGEVHFCLEDLKCEVTGLQPLRRTFSVGDMVAHLGDLGAEDAMATRGAIEMRAPSKADMEAVETYLEHVTGFAKQALAPLVFLVASIFLPALAGSGHGICISVRSAGLPVGAGLGSSAALSVASAAALLRLLCLTSGGAKAEVDANSNADATACRPSRCWLSCINEWAYAAEVISTGHPSGIDNTVSCYGAAVECRKNVNNPSDTKITRVAGFPALRILVTDTCVKKKSTASLVAAVRKMRGESPEMTRAVDDVFQAMEACTDGFLGLADRNTEAFSSSSPLSEPKASRLQHLVRMNHGLLNAIGVGHPALDAICFITRNHGFETKLTGAGGGGCAFTVLKEAKLQAEDSKLSGDAAADLRHLVGELEGSGFKCYTSTLAGQGVLWRDGTDDRPAIGGGYVVRLPLIRLVCVAAVAGATWLVFNRRTGS